MKTLSSALSSALGAPVQRPALLVEAAFATTQRWSSMSNVTWNSQSWTARDMRVEGLAVQALRVSGTLVLGNADDAAGTLVLGEGVQDRLFRIWGYDAAATALADVVWLADAVGGSATVTPREVRIALRHRSEFVAAPRTLVTPAAGFNTTMAAPTIVRINGIDYRLERD
jgi:hypothetical protein